jgi:hypothetical protein
MKDHYSEMDCLTRAYFPQLLIDVGSSQPYRAAP